MKDKHGRSAQSIAFGKMATKGFLGIFRSFRYAVKGIATCFCNERNMRIHCITTAFVFWFGWILQFDRVQYVVLAAVCGLVIIAEMFNSSIEMLCDLSVPGFNRAAGQLKDIAAGAVLVSALIALVVGFFLFVEAENLQLLTSFFLDQPLHLALLLLTGIVAIVTIRGAFIPRRYRTREGDQQ